MKKDILRLRNYFIWKWILFRIQSRAFCKPEKMRCWREEWYSIGPNMVNRTSTVRDILHGAAQRPGNLRDMGGGLIRSWWGEQTDHKSHWLKVWICLSSANQSCGACHWLSWRVLIGRPERAHADVSQCMCVLLSWWDRGREGMLMVSLQLNHWVVSGTGTPDKANATKTMCLRQMCSQFTLWHQDISAADTGDI